MTALTASPDNWRLGHMLLQFGDNALANREVYDLKTAILDPTLIPQLVPVASILCFAEQC